NIGTDKYSSYMPPLTSVAHLQTNIADQEIIHPKLLNYCNFNHLYEDKMIMLVNDFMSEPIKEEHMLKLSKEIISFLNPLVVKENLTTFTEIREVINDLPPYTILPLDFFENALVDFPKQDILTKGNWVEIGVAKGGGALFFKA